MLLPIYTFLRSRKRETLLGFLVLHGRLRPRLRHGPYGSFGCRAKCCHFINRVITAEKNYRGSPERAAARDVWDPAPRTDVSDKKIRCTRAILRRRRCTERERGERCSRLFFSGLRRYIGHLPHLVSCLVLRSSLSFFLLLFFPCPFFRRETYNYSFELQRGRMRETRKQTRRVFARSSAFRSSPELRS